MLNYYHVLEVNPDKWTKVNNPGAKAFSDFIVDGKTQNIIKTFGIDKFGSPLFFPDAGWADILSVFTFSRWALEALGATTNLNGLLTCAVGSAYQVDAAYTFSALHLVSRWAILAGFGALLAALATWRQARK